jgi:hypothetical protein
MILFIAANRMNMIPARRMRAKWVRGLIERDDFGKYTLTDAGRAAFGAMREADFDLR